MARAAPWGRPAPTLTYSSPRRHNANDMAHSTDAGGAPPEHFAYELDGLARLVAARDVLDALVVGHWTTSPALVGAVVDLVASAEQRFRWAEALAA